MVRPVLVGSAVDLVSLGQYGGNTRWPCMGPEPQHHGIRVPQKPLQEFEVLEIQAPRIGQLGDYQEECMPDRIGAGPPKRECEPCAFKLLPELPFCLIDVRLQRIEYQLNDPVGQCFHLNPSEI